MPKRILIAVSHDNKELAESLSAHLSSLRRLNGIELDFLYI